MREFIPPSPARNNPASAARNTLTSILREKAAMRIWGVRTPRTSMRPTSMRPMRTEEDVGDGARVGGIRKREGNFIGEKS